jgi:hypothetical protein
MADFLPAFEEMIRDEGGYILHKPAMRVDVKDNKVTVRKGDDVLNTGAGK